MKLTLPKKSPIVVEPPKEPEVIAPKSQGRPPRYELDHKKKLVVIIRGRR